jgi:hypothetical protein
VPDESQVDTNLPLAAKRQKCCDYSAVVPVQEIVDTKDYAGRISARTFENIKKFSACHGVNEQLEFDGISRTEITESSKRKEEINLFGTWDSKQDSAVHCGKGQCSTLSPRYSKIIYCELQLLPLNYLICIITDII